MLDAPLGADAGPQFIEQIRRGRLVHLFEHTAPIGHNVVLWRGDLVTTADIQFVGRQSGETNAFDPLPQRRKPRISGAFVEAAEETRTLDLLRATVGEGVVDLRRGARRPGPTRSSWQAHSLHASRLGAMGRNSAVLTPLHRSIDAGPDRDRAPAGGVRRIIVVRAMLAPECSLRCSGSLAQVRRNLVWL
jgi:hypothetical protein